MRTDLAEVKPEVSMPSPECTHPERWLCYDGYSTELEVLNFLESIVLITKPNVIVETGTWHGFGTIHLAQAAKSNGSGLVISCEIDSDILDIAIKNIAKQELTNIILHRCTGLEMLQELEMKVDFAFLDSGDGDTRCAELRELLPRLNTNGIVAIHDTGSTHPLWRDQVLGITKNLGLKHIQFPTPRGLTLVWR